MPQQHFRIATSFLLAVILYGCSPRPPAAESGMKVTDITVGRSVGADKTITDKTESFKPSDTFYVSVKTEGSAPSATLTARWTYQDGQVVNESTQTIAPTGGAATEFHVSKPNAWPAGNYKVEILLNGTSAGTKNFRVA